MNERVDLIWENLNVKTQKKDILVDCSGRIENSKISVVIGGTGAGKSVLFNILAGHRNLELNIKGNVYITKLKDKVQKDNSLKQAICLVDNSFDYFLSQSVWETLYLAVNFHNIYSEKNYLENKTKKILSILDLNKFVNEKVKNLSLGEKMLLSIGVILAEDPTIILLDEPFEFLDHCHTKNIKCLEKLN